jgi:2-polyprenyl-3-methyl-5-hydroxy-6-metoxy-1,4-benzoquinol methylase
MTIDKNSASVSEYYNVAAEDYHQQYQRSNLYGEGAYPANYFRLQILTRILTSSTAKSVYEIGVGEGTPLLTMAKSGFAVAGCDISENMVFKARENFKANGVSEDLIRWGDIEDATTFAPQLANGKFDAVVAAGVLPHVRNDGMFLQNLKMIVKPGGKVLIEFRNKLFSLFTMNRYTKEFILDDLLRGVSSEVKDAVADELNKRLATELPPVRTVVTNERGVAPGFDAILAKFHNPFELTDTFTRNGYSDLKIHWYHYHSALPMLEESIGASFRAESIKLEHEGSWRGHFLCSAGIIEGTLSQ